MAQCVRAREGDRAGRRQSSRATKQSANQPAGNAAKRFPHDTLHYLRRRAKSKGRDQLLDLIPFRLLTELRADVMHEAHLQREDAEVGETIGEQLKCRGERGLIEDMRR